MACILWNLTHRALLLLHRHRIPCPLCAKGPNASRSVDCDYLSKVSEERPASEHSGRSVQPCERPLSLMPTTPCRVVIADADKTQDWRLSNILKWCRVSLASLFFRQALREIVLNSV